MPWPPEPIHGALTVQGGFLSLTSGPASGDDAAYLRWHLLDHLPEQFSIAGIRLGTRWRADDVCASLRIAEAPELAPVRHAVLYLLAEPLEDTLTEFARLGRRLFDEGRYPEAATPHLLGAFEVLDARAAVAAVVSAAAVPFRPHRGAYLVIERAAPGADLDRWWDEQRSEHLPALVATSGVAGAWTFVATPRLGEDADQGPRFGTAPWDPGSSLVTIVYLDGDIAATSKRLDPLVRARWEGGAVEPRLAGPFRSPVAFEAWPDGP
jgi:hypothetical protein